MKGDFSRIRFNAGHRYSRVLLQQGRVTLDADANEQTEILLHYVRTLARDLIGDHGGPIADGGFRLSVADGAMAIGAGRYYVHGILCECDGCDYAAQPDYELPAPRADGEGGDPLRAFLGSRSPNDDRYWVYLDVWERHLTHVEVPDLREVALGGPDTCTRTRVIWQVKARSLAEIQEGLELRRERVASRLNAARESGRDTTALEALDARLQEAIDDLGDPERACAAPLTDLEAPEDRMWARLEKGARPKTPCIVAPDARYRGAENQLYRVEIHRGGTADQATFKWSRDNGSVLTRWLARNGRELHVENPRGFSADSWVELSDDARDLRGEPGELVRVVKVEESTLTLDADSATIAATLALSAERHSKVRGWDQDGDGLAAGIPLLGTNPQAWRDLEDGIQVHFDPEGEYRSGDYWLIPARVAGGPEGGIDWPTGAALPASRIEHHYAPLGIVGWSSQDRRTAALEVTSCLCTLRPLTPCQAARLRTVLPVDDRSTPVAPIGRAKRPRKKPKSG